MNLLHTSTPRTLLITSVSFAPDGQLIFSGALDGIIRLWGIP
ncbi:MAG: WD40 domain-containing protein [Anaerolineae bacterium]|nr:WD40 domain-containing protein [Anaerolineae bacterium]